MSNDNRFSKILRNELQEALNKTDYSFRKIAKILEISVSCLTREIKLGMVKTTNSVIYGKDKRRRLVYERYIYSAKRAHEKALIRQANCHKPYKIKNNPKLKEFIIDRLKESWKPDVISGRLKLDYPNNKNLNVAKETIYNWLYNDEEGQRYVHLLQKGNKKQRNKRKPRALDKAEKIKNRVSIHERPDITNMFGVFEGDTVLSMLFSSGHAIHTEVEKKTKMLFARKMIAKTAVETKRAMEEIFTPLKHIAKSITLDNGTEFALHYKINENLNIKTYFADPYSSWQRGCNERHNGLLRRFIPKKTDLNTVSQADLDEYVSFWNNMPRKVLGYKTPLECWNEEIAP